MNPAGFMETTLRLGLLVAGLLLPGSMGLRALRIPWSLAAALLLSGAALYFAVLIFTCTGCPITLGSLTLALAIISLMGYFASRGQRSPAGHSSFECFTQMGLWSPLYLAFWLIIGYRLIAQPLSGPDVYFRWSYLAEQMLKFGSLDFYPPLAASDYTRYFWVESIPPGIASLYAWAYACGNSTAALWTSPIVALQLISLHEIVWRLGFRQGGKEVARLAVLLLAASPLLNWSFLIGQETGLTAVALCGLIWSLFHLREGGAAGWAVVAGIFAVVAASTREYGPIFPLAAIAAALVLKIPRQRILILALVALPVTAVWPLRVAWITGNPFYSLSLANLFPTNTVFTAWNDAYRAHHAFDLGSLVDWRALFRYGLLWGLPSFAGLAAVAVLVFRKERGAGCLAGFSALTFALWFASTYYTAGGLFYSLRVLCPALALLTVAAGQLLISYSQTRAKTAPYLAAITFLVTVESFPKTLALPVNPYWIEPREWSRAGTEFISAVYADDQEVLRLIEPLQGRDRILTDHAGMPRVLARIGTEALPFWSPEVAWLFDRKLAPEELASRWAKSGLRYVVLAKAGTSADYIRAEARWNTHDFSFRTVASTQSQLIIEVTVTVPATR